MTTMFNVKIHHKFFNYNIDININNDDTIDQVKQQICNKINGDSNNKQTENIGINKLRLYPIVDDIIKTGFSFYGLIGNGLFLDNHFETNNYVVFLML